MRGSIQSIGQGFAGGLIAGGLLLAGFIAATANTTGADGGDWLNFAGVIFGVALTVAATLGIERLRERARHRRAVRLILIEIPRFKEHLRTFGETKDTKELEYLKQIVALISALASDISRDRRAATVMAHMFTFHVPPLIEKLQQATEMQSLGTPSRRQELINEIRGYGAGLGSVLDDDPLD